MLRLALTFSVVVATVTSVPWTKPPHIILIIGDDVGFNDVSFRGSEDIPTPNIDALGYSGRILDRHYVLSACSPSRASLLTGLHAVRTGMHGFPLRAGEPRALPLNFTLLPEYLQRLNYSTHLVGKWHQGYYRWPYTPTRRGYSTFLGYYNGFIGYWGHDVLMSDWTGDPKKAPNGYDMHRNEKVAYDLRGRYATEIFTEEAERIIWDHDVETPLFLEISHLASHTGKGGTEMEVPSEPANNRRFGFIRSLQRRRLAGVMSALDDSIGRVIRALADRDMLADSLIVFFSDNGAPTTGPNNNAGSNWPLRGQKLTLFEGAIRSAAVVWHAGMKPTSTLHGDIIHVMDWLPTFYEAAGGNVSDLGEIDGVSQWSRLSGEDFGPVGLPPPRKEFFVTSENNSASAYVDNFWKLAVGSPDFPRFGIFSGEAGRTPGAPPYNLCGVTSSATARFLAGASQHSDLERLGERAAQLRRLATLPVTCRRNATYELPNCTSGCLYNLLDDPCETTNLVNKRPDIVSALMFKLRNWESKRVPMLDTAVDRDSDPTRFGGAWVPWMDVQPEVSQPGSSPKPDEQLTGKGSLIRTDCSISFITLCAAMKFLFISPV